jgi:hypothetical protein
MKTPGLKSAAFDFKITRMNTDPKDETRLNFVTGKAHQLSDLSEREAALVDDVSGNGERELTPFERHSIDRMMDRFNQQRLK